MSWLREMSGEALPPKGLAEWAATQPTLVAAWRECPRPEWQLWLAAHLKGRTHQDERTIIAAGMTLFPETSFIFDILQYASPIPTERDALDAWSRDAVRSLTQEQRLIASSTAFVVALLIGIAIDRIWGARFAVGVARTTWQAFLTLAIWLPLIPVMRSLRRRMLQRTAGTWSFTDALDHVLKTVQARTESTSESERRELANSVRVEMLGVTKRHFS
jgi:hypothetical protein